MREPHDVARTNLRVAQKIQKPEYDLKVNERSYKVGDVIYQLDTAVVKGKCKKLCPPRKGPGVVVEKLTPYLYRVRLKDAVTTANHDRLKTCMDRDIPVWVKKLQNKLSSGQRWDEGVDTSPSGARVEKGGRKYCLCRKGHDGRIMVQCDGCKE